VRPDVGAAENTDTGDDQWSVDVFLTLALAVLVLCAVVFINLF
jgi:hypothetical protein